MIYKVPSEIHCRRVQNVGCFWWVSDKACRSLMGPWQSLPVFEGFLTKHAGHCWVFDKAYYALGSATKHTGLCMGLCPSIPVSKGSVTKHAGLFMGLCQIYRSLHGSVTKHTGLCMGLWQSITCMSVSNKVLDPRKFSKRLFLKSQAKLNIFLAFTFYIIVAVGLNNLGNSKTICDFSIPPPGESCIKFSCFLGLAVKFFWIYLNP